MTQTNPEGVVYDWKKTWVFWPFKTAKLVEGGKAYFGTVWYRRPTEEGRGQLIEYTRKP